MTEPCFHVLSPDRLLISPVSSHAGWISTQKDFAARRTLDESVSGNSIGVNLCWLVGQKATEETKKEHPRLTLCFLLLKGFMRMMRVFSNGLNRRQQRKQRSDASGQWSAFVPFVCFCKEVLSYLHQFKFVQSR